jgi:hypothetical protein
MNEKGLSKLAYFRNAGDKFLQTHHLIINGRGGVESHCTVKFMTSETFRND